jgi:thioredoxin 1
MYYLNQGFVHEKLGIRPLGSGRDPVFYTQEGMRFRIAFSATLVLSLACAAENALVFPPLASWQEAITRQNAIALKMLYSSSPPAQISTDKESVDPASEVAFWVGLKAKSMHLKVVQADSSHPGVYKILFQATVQTAARTVYVNDVQVWQQRAGGWNIVASKREVAKLEQPLSIDEKIYPTGDAHTEIRDALARAGRSGKRVLVIFGADLCYDCHVLDKAFQRYDIAAVLNPNFEVVHIDIGEGDKNQDLLMTYQVPTDRRIPAIAVLDSSGKLLYSQRNGEWSHARALGPEDLLQLLNKWKPRG